MAENTCSNKDKDNAFGAKSDEMLAYLEKVTPVGVLRDSVMVVVPLSELDEYLPKRERRCSAKK